MKWLTVPLMSLRRPRAAYCHYNLILLLWQTLGFCFSNRDVLGLQFTAELRTLLRSYGPKNYGMQGFCPIAEGNLIGKTRYVRSLKGCEQ